GAYTVHDQLHLRGGHQVTWLLDGVPVPNTNIASNVGPQFDPKDIEYLELQRGGYSAENGDRTYGVFNVVTRSGFERKREGELITSFGSFNQTNDQINFGSHSERFAYYGSVSGNRSDLGLETPVTKVIHDAGSGLSGFTSLLFNASPKDQIRTVAAVRGDHFQVPNDPDAQAAGVRDVEDERDAFVNFSWVHTLAEGIVATVSPFYHFNRAHFIGGSGDTPFIANDDHGSTYAGGVVTLNVLRGHHSLHAGLQGFAQRDNQLINVIATDGSGDAFRERQIPRGAVQTLFLEDQYRITGWLALNAGLRWTRFSAGSAETATDPRIGAAIQVPKLKWVLRGFYGRYYQAPPLLTVSGPVLNLAAQQGLGFLPLKGERDENHEFGLAIPYRGFALELSHFRTGAKNYFDHDVLGDSNIFFPLTIARARIRGWEASLRSPEIAHRVKVHMAYSRQYVQGRGGVTGGVTDFQPPADNSYFYLDHDQRDTLSTGFDAKLPKKVWAAGNLSYGSGFLDGNGPGHLPTHTTFDLSAGRALGEKWSVVASVVNVSNSRHLLDNSNTFGGTHFNDPRQFMVQVKYKFHY
ncbi:MAG TPA: TonB-dependent receptor, partial [Alphaproteobacteria bacterium]|nr:TonB-dependent receptor [Alphaproteobacteria bacterium]